jgi:hypothetical protein
MGRLTKLIAARGSIPLTTNCAPVRRATRVEVNPVVFEKHSLEASAALLAIERES